MKGKILWVDDEIDMLKSNIMFLKQKGYEVSELADLAQPARITLNCEIPGYAVKAGGEVDLTCGGAPMLALGTEPPDGAAIAEDAKGGTQIGKRYIDAAGALELLCTKPGDGSLALAGAELTIKGAKPLPSSD